MSVNSDYWNVPQQTRGIHTMVFQCWASVEDGGPTLKQHCVNVSCCWDRLAITLTKPSLKIMSQQPFQLIRPPVHALLGFLILIFCKSVSD